MKLRFCLNKIESVVSNITLCLGIKCRTLVAVAGRSRHRKRMSHCRSTAMFGKKLFKWMVNVKDYRTRKQRPSTLSEIRMSHKPGSPNDLFLIPFNEEE